MRFLLVSLAFVFGLFLVSCGGSEDVASYDILFISDKSHVWDSQEEIDNWLNLVSDSMSLLPDGMIQTMTANGEEKLTFYINAHPNELNEGVAGRAGGGVGGDIMFYIPAFEGISPAEKTYVVIHEVGHIYHDADAEYDVLAFLNRIIGPDGYFIEFPSTLSAFRTWVWDTDLQETENGVEVNTNRQELIVGEYDAREDYGNTFALFVMWPEKLRECCPVRYEFMKNAFGEEYTVFAGITDSEWVRGALIQEIRKQGINITYK